MEAWAKSVIHRRTDTLGLLGSSAIIPAGKRYLHNQRIGLVEFSGLTNIDRKFLFYLFNSKPIRKIISNEAAGTKVRHTSPKKLLGIEVSLPSIEEQRRIAEILGTWDRAIETTQKLITASEAQKKALMQQLLTGQKRLPGFKGEWREVQLGEVVEIDPETLGSATPLGFYMQYISLSEVTSGEIEKELPRISFAEAPSRARKVVTKGYLLVSTVRPNLQGFAKVRRTDNDLVASTGFAVLRARTKTNIDFVFHWLFCERITKQLHALVAGSNYPAVTTNEVSALRIDCPSPEEQFAIAQILNDADCVISSLRAKFQTLKTEKAALMQQLLTGKRRVNVKEMAA